MQDILSRLSEIFQSGAKVIIFEASKAVGEQFAKEAPETAKADIQQLLNITVQRFTEAGLGKIEVTQANLEQGELKFRIWNNFFAEIKNKEGETYCNCIEGFVSGMCEYVMKKRQISKKLNAVQMETLTASGTSLLSDGKSSFYRMLNYLKPVLIVLIREFSPITARCVRG